MSIRRFWREQAAQLIDQVLTDCRAKGLGQRETERAISAAYPLGKQRRGLPYQLWQAEKRRALKG
jgi:hypothetical protein